MRKLLIILLFASCTTQRKVERYLDKHKEFTADYCSDKFPVWEHVDTVVSLDTAYYEQAYNEMWKYTEELLNRINILENTSEFMYIPVKTNLDSLYHALQFSIKRSLKPCKDSTRTIIRTVEDKARIAQLMQERTTLIQSLNTYKAMAKIRLRFLIGIAAALFILIAFQTRKYWL